MKKGELEQSPVSQTASEFSHKAHRSKGSEAEKLHAESTTYPTLSTKPSDPQIIKNCGCSDKRDVFFDKLINYLEKQSEVISRCYIDEKTVTKHNKRLNTDPIYNKTQSPCSQSSSPTNSKDNKILKSKDNEYKIIVEVCTCDKDKDEVKPSASRKSVKPHEQSHSEDKKRHRSVANETDCSGCEKKVANFFKLADEICQAYLKRCLMNDDLNNIPSSFLEHNEVKIEDLDCLAEPRTPKRTREDKIQHRTDNRDGKGCNSLAVQIECHGDTEEFVIQPCDCRSKSGRVPSYYQPGTSQDDVVGNQSPKKTCLEVFEERYGQILRDLHSKLKHPQPTAVHGNQPPPPGAQQQYPASQHPTYPPPENWQPQQLPNQSEHQQPQPNRQTQPYPQPQPNRQTQPYPQPQPNRQSQPYPQPQPNQQYQPYPQPQPNQQSQPYPQPQPNQQFQPYQQVPPNQDPQNYPTYHRQSQDRLPSDPNVPEQNRKPSKASASKEKKKKKGKVE